MLDPVAIEQLVKEQIKVVVEQLIDSSIEGLVNDTSWLAKVEDQINQAVVNRVVMQFGQIDVNPIIKERVDEHMDRFQLLKPVLDRFQQDLLKNFSSAGISDQSTSRQLTIMDDAIVAENQLMSRELTVAGVAVVQDLVVKGSVNIDNPTWDLLADGISEKTINRLSDTWKTLLTAQVAEQIKTDGIEFDSVSINGEPLVSGNTLANSITETNIKSLGTLNTLTVDGESTFNNQTLSVLNKRIGVNTLSPEMALSIWDEEVSIVIGKNKVNEAYIGTNRAQGVAIGVNRQPEIEISTDGLTKIRQLQVGVHRIGHAAQVPGYAGTKGDIVFNADAGDSSVFAWVCIGGHRWKTLKSAE